MVTIHGVTKADVKGKPPFVELHPWLFEITENKIVASHGHFDRSAIRQACVKYGLPQLNCDWLDTARVARRAWPEFSKAGYGLSALADHFGIAFSHHNALEDARLAGQVLVKAVEKTGILPEDWLVRSLKRVTHPDVHKSSEVRLGQGDGPLAQETVVFTGRLTLSRNEAADKANQLGASVSGSVTKKTTMLVVGNQDIEKLAGHEKSTKHRKAEDLIKNGVAIRILTEEDFLSIID